MNSTKPICHQNIQKTKQKSEYISCASRKLQKQKKNHKTSKNRSESVTLTTEISYQSFSLFIVFFNFRKTFQKSQTRYGDTEKIKNDGASTKKKKETARKKQQKR